MSVVRETRTINIEYNPVSGRKMLNRYEIYGELGRGQHGKVKLGKDSENGQYVAIKTVDRKDRPRLGRPSTSTSEAKVRQEIAILKKCKHPNIVQLLEVLDDSSSRKIYLVLEYLEKGEVKWQNADQSPALTPERAREVFIDTLMGLEYLHAHGIIHRDIKPANLLLSRDSVVKISDFGVSYAFTSQDCDELEMAKTVGSPAFFAPEMCIFDETANKPRITGKIDVWALGVTLFCLLYGYLPFDADNEYELFRVISKQPLQLPKAKTNDLEQANDLLKRLLEKDPLKRIEITDIRNHPWVKATLRKAPAQPEKTKVSDEEVDKAVRGIASRIKSSFSRLMSRSRSRGGEIAGSPPSATPLVSQRVSRKGKAVAAGSVTTSTSTASVDPSQASRQSVAPELLLTSGSSVSSLQGSGPELPIGRPYVSKPPGDLPQHNTDRTMHPEVPQSEPITRQQSPQSKLPHINSEPGKISLPSHVLQGQMRYPSEDTLNAPPLRSSSSSSGSDSDSDGGQLTLVIGRKRSPPVPHP